MTTEATNTGHRSLDGKMISVTAPALDEADNLEPLCRRIKGALTPLAENFEIVIFDTASTDTSIEILRRLAKDGSRIKHVLLYRNFGHRGGLLAGMHDCSGDIVVLVPVVNNSLITPHAEAFQAVVWHCLVSHPALQVCATKW